MLVTLSSFRQAFVKLSSSNEIRKLDRGSLNWPICGDARVNLVRGVDGYRKFTPPSSIILLFQIASFAGLFNDFNYIDYFAIPANVLMLPSCSVPIPQ